LVTVALYCLLPVECHKSTHAGHSYHTAPIHFIFYIHAASLSCKCRITGETSWEFEVVRRLTICPHLQHAQMCRMKHGGSFGRPHIFTKRRGMGNVQPWMLKMADSM
jgi:hypothetical protein